MAQIDTEKGNAPTILKVEMAPSLKKAVKSRAKAERRTVTAVVIQALQDYIATSPTA